MLPCVNGLRQLRMDDVTGMSQPLPPQLRSFWTTYNSTFNLVQSYSDVQLGPSIQACVRTKFTNTFTHTYMSHEVEIRIPLHIKWASNKNF
jgi:hypothetical protein